LSNKRGKHQKANSDIALAIRWLESINEVKRVIISGSESCRHKYAPGTLKVRHKTLGGLMISGYGGQGITNIYLNISPVDKTDAVIKLINERYN
jgi:hypothetical protein